MALTKVTLGGGGAPTGPTPFSLDNKPRLNAVGTPDFSSPQVLPNSEGQLINYRMGGPIFAAALTDRVYSSVTVPLRGANILDGDQLFLGFFKRTSANNYEVVKAEVKAITVGQGSATFEGPFIIPAGAVYGFAYGMNSGAGWSDRLSVFYGNSDNYDASVPYVFKYDYPIAPVVGGVTAIPAESLGGKRALTLHGANTPKGVLGQLELSDLPAGAFSTAHAVPLNSSGTADVAMPLIDNYDTDARYFGSSTATLTQDYTFSGITVPLVGANVQAGMVLKVLVGKQVGGFWTLHSFREATLAAGQSSQYFELPINMKQGERWCVLPGLKFGGFNDADAVFYERSGAVAPEPFAFYWIYANNDPGDTLGVNMGLSEGFSLVYQRAFTLHGENVVKGVEGKLPPEHYILAGDSSKRSLSPVLGELFFDTTLMKLIVWDGGTWANAGTKGDQGTAGVGTKGDQGIQGVQGPRGVAQLERSFQAAGTLRIGFTAPCTLSSPTVFHNGTSAPTMTYARSVGMAGAQTTASFPQAIAAGEVLHIGLVNMVDATDVSVAFDLS